MIQRIAPSAIAWRGKRTVWPYRGGRDLFYTAADEAQAPISVVLNWQEGLRK